MPIVDLQVRQGKVDIVLDIVDKGDVREFDKFGKAGRVCNATARDETGEIKLTLWNDDIDKVNVGDKVHLVNGYVSEWQGEKQLSTGKFGTMEVVGKGSVEISREDKKEVEELDKEVEKVTSDDLDDEELDDEDIISDEESVE